MYATPSGGDYAPSEEEKANRLDSILICVRAGQTIEQATRTPACYQWFLHALTKSDRAPIIRALMEEQAKSEQHRRKRQKK